MRKLLQLAALFMCLSAWPELKAGPLLQDAHIDLSAWNGKEQLSMEGDWGSFDDEWLHGAEIQQRSAGPFLKIPVPTPPDFQTKTSSGRYQRTMFVRITGLHADRPVGIYLEAMSLYCLQFSFYHVSSGREYLLGELGHADSDPQKRLHVYSGNNTISLPAVDGEGYLLVHSTSYPFFKGVSYPYAIGGKPIIGDPHYFAKQSRRHFYEVSFVLGLFIFLGLLNFALFIQRPEEPSNLYLAALAVAWAWRYTGTDGFIAQVQYEPSMTSFLLNQASLAYSPVLGGFILSIFMRATYPRFVPRWFPWLYVFIFVYMLQGTIRYSLNYTQIQWIEHTIAGFLLFLVICYFNFRAVVAGELGARLGIIGFIAIFLAHLNDFFVATSVYNSFYLGHYSFVFLIFTQSLIVGRRFALSFQATQRLGQELQLKNADLESKQTEIKMLNRDLQNYAETLEIKVEDKTRDIVSILSSIRQGILAVKAPDGSLAPEHSRYLEPMLGIKQTDGYNVVELCFKESSLSADRIDQAQNALAMIIGEDQLAFELNQDALPKELSKKHDGTLQHFELDWSPVLAGQRIDKVLLVLRDVTEIRKLRLAAEDQASELSLIADIINVPKERFEGLITSAERLLEANQDLLVRVDHLDPPFVDRLYRNLHTVKGMTRTYQLRQVTELVHIAEERYKQMRLGQTCEKSTLLQDLTQIMQVLNKMLQINRQKLGRSAAQDQRYILIDRIQFNENLRHIREIDIQAINNADKSRFECIRELFFKVAYTPLAKVLDSQLESLTNLAQSLNKETPKVQFIDPGFSINREAHEIINNVFNHLLRNSIDHGIEHPEIRKQLGKNPWGQLTIKLCLFHGQLRIDYFDDGAGLNLLKIRDKAILKGIVKPEQRFNQQALANLILQPDFSTADRVTDISGRGVGMDAVRSFLEEIHGSFDIELSEPLSEEIRSVPAHFVIILPETLFQKMESRRSDMIAA